MPKYKSDSQNCSRPDSLSYGYKRLQFFYDFLKANGLSMEDYAKLLGKSSFAVRNYFAIDDVNISIVYKTADMLGFDFIPSIYPVGKEDSKKLIDISSLLLEKQNRNFELRKLYFLDIAIKQSGLNKAQLAERVKISYASIRNWFVKDDIAVSRVFQLCREMNWCLDFQFLSKERDLNCNEDAFVKYNISIFRGHKLFLERNNNKQLTPTEKNLQSLKYRQRKKKSENQ